MFARFSNVASVALLAFAAACSPETTTVSDSDAAKMDSATVAQTPAPAATTRADWAGKWVGAEGMFVEISPTGNGTYSLTMQSDLDTSGTYAGQDAEGGIAFERSGEKLLLKAATGDQTELKYLAGKKDCLMVAAGEGYCRD